MLYMLHFKYFLCNEHVTKVASFFHRELLSIGLVAMSLWAFSSSNRHRCLVSIATIFSLCVSD